MKNYELLNTAVVNVETSFDMLIDEFYDLQKEVRVIMHELVEKQDYQELNELIEMQQLASDRIEIIRNIQKEWNDFLSRKQFVLDNEEIDENDDGEESGSAIDRTSWKVVGDIVRIETSRPNNKSPYNNNIPVQLFHDVVLACLDQFERYEKTLIKTSTINGLMKEKIIKESSYKKATMSAVYSIFKVLQKESILAPFENMKRAYTLNKSVDEIKDWLENSLK